MRKINSGAVSLPSTVLMFGLPMLCIQGLVMQNAVAETEHEFGGEFRPRYADLQEGDEPGKSASVLLRGNVKSQWTEKLSTLVEIDYVANAYEDDYSNGLNMNGKPLFPDVPGEDLNQLWLRYEFDFASVLAGRQDINLDDQRFVSTVGFWQNEQTFDALRMDKPMLSASSFMYGYVGNVNRIQGEDADEDRPVNKTTNQPRPPNLLGDHKQDTHLLRLEINEWDFTQWVVYAYFIDNKDLPEWSNNTFGTRYEVTVQPDALRYHVEAELARQQRTELTQASGEGDKPANNYAKLYLSAAYSSFEVGVRYEYLGSQQVAGSEAAIITPMGSLQEFQGWADGLNPIHGVRGIEDSSLKIKWRHHPWKFDLRYHQFNDTESSISYGNEIDLDVSFDVAKAHEIHFRFGDFQVDEEASSFLQDRKIAVLSYHYDF